jgi:hypothetical protein
MARMERLVAQRPTMTVMAPKPGVVPPVVMSGVCASAFKPFHRALRQSRGGLADETGLQPCDPEIGQAAPIQHARRRLYNVCPHSNADRKIAARRW